MITTVKISNYMKKVSISSQEVTKNTQKNDDFLFMISRFSFSKSTVNFYVRTSTKPAENVWIVRINSHTTRDERVNVSASNSYPSLKFEYEWMKKLFHLDSPSQTLPHSGELGCEKKVWKLFTLLCYCWYCSSHFRFVRFENRKSLKWLSNHFPPSLMSTRFHWNFMEIEFFVLPYLRSPRCILNKHQT